MTETDKQNLFMELYEPCESSLSGFARAMTGNREDASDLVSDVLLTVYENFDKIKNRSMFKPYLFTTASRIWKRKRFRAKIFGKYDAETAEMTADGSASPETSVDIKFLYEALEKLSAKMKEAVILFEISGFSIAEIKEIQGGSLSGVKTRLARGRQKLAELMDADDSSINMDNERKESKPSNLKRTDNFKNGTVNFNKLKFNSMYSEADNEQ